MHWQARTKDKLEKASLAITGQYGKHLSCISVMTHRRNIQWQQFAACALMNDLLLFPASVNLHIRICWQTAWSCGCFVYILVRLCLPIWNYMMIDVLYCRPIVRDENGRKRSAKDSTIFTFIFFSSEMKAVRYFRKRKRRRYFGNFENGNIRSRTHR